MRKWWEALDWWFWRQRLKADRRGIMRRWNANTVSFHAHMMYCVGITGGIERGKSTR